MYLSGGKYLSL